jgi:hypothetical protein
MRDVDAGLRPLGTQEFRMFSKAYPKTIGHWMDQGARSFNTAVMSNGIKEACAYAVRVRQRAEALAKHE